MDRAEQKLYFQQMKDKAAVISLSDPHQRLAFLLIQLSERGYNDYEINAEIKEQLLILASSEEQPLFEPLVAVIDELLDDGYAYVFRYIAKHAAEYPYSTGYARRPFRTKEQRLHLDRLLTKMISLFYLHARDFSVADYLAKPNYISENEHQFPAMAIADIIAYGIDNGDEAIIHALKEIIYGDNNTALLSRSMISGIFLSHSREAYRMMGELLVAARLQEGLRQSIVEAMDEGTIEAMIYMLEVVTEHDLIRYSSVIRALDVWTGLGLEASNARVARQNIAYAAQCLADPAVLRQGLASGDVNELYMSLWAIAVHEEKQLYEQISLIMASDENYRKIVAQYMLAQSQNEDIRFLIAQDWLGEPHKEVQYWVVMNYTFDYSYTWESDPKGTYTRLVFRKSVLLAEKTVRRRQFEQFMAMLSGMPLKDSEERSEVFHWVGYTFSTDTVIRKLLYLTAYDMDQEWLAEIFALKDRLSHDMRGELLKFFINDPSSSAQRSFLIACLSDKSMTNRELAMQKAAELELNEDEIEAVALLLKLKTGALRQGAIGLLLKQSARQLEAVLAMLLQSRNELQRLAALELLTEMKDEPALAQLSGFMKDEVDLIEAPSDKERLLIAKLKQQTVYTLSNGLGLFNPEASQEELSGKEQLQMSALQAGKRYFNLTTEQIGSFIKGLADLVHLHREHEYETTDYSGAKETLLVGAKLTSLQWRYEPNDATPTLERYPLAQVWADYLEKSGFGAAELLQLHFFRSADSLYRYYYGEQERWHAAAYEPAEGWRKELLDQLYPMELLRETYLLTENVPYRMQVNEIISAYLRESRWKERFDAAEHFLSLIMSCFPAERVKEESRLLDLFTEFWRKELRTSSDDDVSFAQLFRIFYPLYEMFGFEVQLLDTMDFARAFSLGIIDKNELLKELVARPHSSSHIRQLTNPKGKLNKQYPQLNAVKELIVRRILELELNRGDLTTEVTHLATSIQHVEGMNDFIAILKGLDKEAFVRGYIYGYGKDITRKETFSHLLKVCHPRNGEDEAMLRELLQDSGISETRLLEAAMYAPQWVELVSSCLGWSGLRSAAWYFHAHINESFSAEKETIVAQYSPIAPQDFNDGAFDIDWFRQAYDELGEERFRLLYQCAKYISAGANHRRSQLFADAVLGRLNAGELQAQVAEKRNKDLLLSYSLLPWRKDGEETREVLERYSFIQRFWKESKAFGAQRRASEEKASSIALDNLARNAGYADVIRLTWDMEGRKLDELLHYFEPHALDELTSAQLVIDESGKTDIRVMKQGKTLKSLPAAYKKHEYIAALKETKTELTDQYKRARAELERSMVSGSSFTLREISRLVQNPVLLPLVNALVFKINQNFGYFDKGMLESPQAQSYQITENDQLVIAHPLHLYESGEWSSYQKDLFDRQVKQPFKQVFRELYLPTVDELASGSLSRRYAGHQVQPRKTLSLLKGRKWTVSYEEGLQKVFYKENVIASIYALADWFSPSDIESPTLETVRFFDRKTLKGLAIAQVPSLIFSEVMRDVDLVVSVAHVGGVDPEASLTTIGIRTAIVTESLRLLKITNVRLEGNHALIAGKLGEYSVHLGSGTVYKQAKGALAIIPVHSQHRGRLFLPFMDEDPKTAEILSKIMLLAQDTKLKDPQILAQLQV